MTNIATDADGKPILDGLTTITFSEQNGKTKLTVDTAATALVPGAVSYLKGMKAGWMQSLERLDQEARTTGREANA